MGPDEPSPAGPRPSRRAFGVGAVAALGAWSLHRPAAAQPLIRPRSDWAGNLGPVGTLSPEEVRFLLVHHTAEPGNDHGAADVPGLLRGIYGFHTGSKGWPDIAYNFFVDRFGGVWEGRSGSLAGPVQGSATGGNQGFSQLCCFLGNTDAVPPTPEAAASMARLLAWLADRYGIATAPGSTVQFQSRGSNRHPAGSNVTAATISVHSDMSATSCPGAAATAWARGPAWQVVNDFRSGGAVPTTVLPTTAAPVTTVPPTTAAPATTTPPISTTPPTTTTTMPSTTVPQSSTTSTADVGGATESAASTVQHRDPSATGLAAAAGVAAGAAALAGWAVHSRRKGSVDPEADGRPQQGM